MTIWEFAWVAVNIWIATMIVTIQTMKVVVKPMTIVVK